MISKFQLKSWLNSGETADKVFMRLNLNSGMENILSNPKLNTYATYVDMFNKEHPGSTVTMTSALTKTYGDAAVAKMLDAGSKVASTETMAKKLQVEMYHGWLAKGDSTDDVFKALSLDTSMKKLISGPNLQTMAAYVRLFNKNNPEQKTTLMKTITASYDDADVARELATTIISAHWN